MPIRYQPVDIDPADAGWELLPLRFHRFDLNRVLLTNMVGEHLFVTAKDFDALMNGTLPSDRQLRRDLAGKHLIRATNESIAVELLAMKTRTRYRRLADFTSLHIFVATLRCEHTCQYCQVSRQSSANDRYDMTPETAQRALQATFQSPSQAIKIEIQGGEPLLNFGLVRDIITDAEVMNAQHQKQLSFVIASNLALLDDTVLDFAAAHDVHFSTSLDGPADLHNTNRPRPGRDSWQRAIAGIEQVRRRLGPDRVSALMTTTAASLTRVRDIIDCYVEHDLREVFLRPVSPYGFAARRARPTDDVAHWLAFYTEGLDYILELNARGVPMIEHFAAIVLKKMLTNDDPGYVDLTSPAGIGIGALVYNYDGDVYASDEGRMLAEMGDTTFRLGNLHTNTYTELMTSDALLEPLEASFTHSAPMCSDCAFEPYCGADPVFHHATAGDFLGRKPESAFCQRNMGIFELLLDRYDSDPQARQVFQRWANR
jgi:uncharacterized protein